MPAAAPVERLVFELRLLVEGELVVAVEDKFKDVEFRIGTEAGAEAEAEAEGKAAGVGFLDEAADVNVEMILALFLETPSQTKARELNATSARHWPGISLPPSRGVNVG